ncbi:hypothetical protein BZA77DRAFT_350139 [Pyronema omphalodes]|nr:hypothetical protein BZA77DRAFT_350139 [Pyronema omphalodes]
MLDVIQRLLIGTPKRPPTTQSKPRTSPTHPISPQPIPVPVQTPPWLQHHHREHQPLDTILESPFEFPVLGTVASSITSSSSSSDSDSSSVRSSDLPVPLASRASQAAPKLPDEIFEHPVFRNRGRMVDIPSTTSSSLSVSVESLDLGIPRRPRGGGAGLDGLYSRPIVKIDDVKMGGKKVFMRGAIVKKKKLVEDGENGGNTQLVRRDSGNEIETRRVDCSSPAWNKKVSSVPPSNMVLRTQNGKRIQVQLVDTSGPVSSSVSPKPVVKMNNGKSISVRLVGSGEPKQSSGNIQRDEIQHVNPSGPHCQPTKIQAGNSSNSIRPGKASSISLPKPVIKKPSIVYPLSGGHTNFPSTRHVNFLHDPTTTQNRSFGSPFIFVSPNNSSSRSSVSLSDPIVDVSPRPEIEIPHPLDAPEWNTVTPEAPTPAPSLDETSEETQASPVEEGSLTEQDLYPHPVATEIVTGHRPPRVIDVDSEMHGVMPFMILLLSMPFIGIATHTGSVITLGQGLKSATRNIKFLPDRKIVSSRCQMWCAKRLERQKPLVNRYLATKEWRVNVPPYDMSSLDQGVPGRARDLRIVRTGGQRVGQMRTGVNTVRRVSGVGQNQRGASFQEVTIDKGKKRE